MQVSTQYYHITWKDTLRKRALMSSLKWIHNLSIGLETWLLQERPQTTAIMKQIQTFTVNMKTLMITWRMDTFRSGTNLNLLNKKDLKAMLSVWISGDMSTIQKHACMVDARFKWFFMVPWKLLKDTLDTGDHGLCNMALSWYSLKFKPYGMLTTLQLPGVWQTMMAHTKTPTQEMDRKWNSCIQSWIDWSNQLTKESMITIMQNGHMSSELLMMSLPTSCHSVKVSSWSHGVKV